MIKIPQTIDSTLKQCIEDVDQTHIFAYWHELSGAERRQLIEQLQTIDFEWLKEARASILNPPPVLKPRAALQPVETIGIPETDEEKQKADQARQMGEDLIRSGAIAAFLVAGGQGTRLGFSGPKGEFSVGPVSGKSLFQLFAEKIMQAQRHYRAAVPWVLMTSDTTHEATVKFFQRHDFWGLDKKNCFFIQQAMLPAIDTLGRLILDAKNHIYLSPNGHGGTFSALDDSGVLAELKGKGIDILSYFQVDNPLVRLIDPVFIGYHQQHASPMSSKIVRKTDPEEKVGVFGLANNRLKVIEYSSLTKEEKHRRLPGGRLEYDAANIAIHLLNVDFIQSVIAHHLPLPRHKAFKAVPVLDESGQVCRPDKPNGYKFETFVFDVLSQVSSSVIMEVKRDEEFSPVKNKTGGDSPETVRQALIHYFGGWLERAGYTLPRDAGHHIAIPVEISPLYADSEEAFLEKVPDNLNVNESVYLDSD